MYNSSEKNECLICFQPSYINQDLVGIIGRDLICGECRNLLNPNVKIERNRQVVTISFYKFNKAASRILVRYKDYGDTPLAPIFLYRYKNIISFLFKGYEVVPIPSIQSHINQRGFNHLNLMLSALKLKVNNCLVNKGQVAQKYRNQQDRAQVNFQLKDIEMIRNKKIIVFDDVMTTGSSVESALSLLKNHCRKIVVIVLFR